MASLPDDFEIPMPEGRDLLPYQVEGVKYAIPRRVTLIADEPGLGKTAQAIAFCNSFQISRVLIVCPSSLKTNWLREWSKFTVHDDLTTRSAAAHRVFPKTDVVIINYELMWKFRTKLRQVVWDVVILDEAHLIKNERTRWSKIILGWLECAKKNQVQPLRFRKMVMLSGTPILNRPVDLWNLCRLGDPKGLGRDYREFTKRYCKGWKAPWGWDATGADNLDELNELLHQRFMIRRLKADVLTQLPPKRRSVIELPTDGMGLDELLQREIALYEMAKSQQIELANEDFEDQVARLKEESAADKVETLNDLAATRQEVALQKLPMAFEFIDGLVQAGQKVIVFCYHLAVADALWERYGAQAAMITGKVPEKERQAQVDRFQTDPGCTVFIGQIKAAGVGHTLTASSTVVFLELDYVPANLIQAEDRAHRISQVNAVMAYYLVLEGSLDASIIRKVIEKQEIAALALD